MVQWMATRGCFFWSCLQVGGEERPVLALQYREKTSGKAYLLWTRDFGVGVAGRGKRTEAWATRVIWGAEGH